MPSRTAVFRILTHLIAIQTLVAVVPASATERAHAFVNDIEVCKQDSLVKGKFRDIVISDNDVVTVFYMAGADTADSLRIHRQYFQRYGADGRALSTAVAV